MLGFYDYTVLLTYAGLVSGVVGIFMAVAYENTFGALICLMISGFCDLFDGKVARTKKNRTEEEKDFGIQIDSMCDLVCFGFLPVSLGIALQIRDIWGLVFMILYILAAVIRLSFFNVMEKKRQGETNEKREYYQGLPVTTVALFFPLLFLTKGILGNHFVVVYELVLLAIAILFVLNFRVKKIEKKFCALLIVAVILVILRFVTVGI